MNDTALFLFFFAVVVAGVAVYINRRNKKKASWGSTPPVDPDVGSDPK